MFSHFSMQVEAVAGVVPSSDHKATGNARKIIADVAGAAPSPDKRNRAVRRQDVGYAVRIPFT